MLIPIGTTGYTIPAGKTLYIISFYGTGGGATLSVGGNAYFSFGSGTSGFLALPMVFPSGSTLSVNTGTLNVTAIER